MDTNTAIAAAALGGVGFAILFQRLRALGSRLDQLSRVESKLDALLRKSGVDYDPLATVPVDVRNAVVTHPLTHVVGQAHGWLLSGGCIMWSACR
jgi:hypothetical protein